MRRRQRKVTISVAVNGLLMLEQGAKYVGIRQMEDKAFVTGNSNVLGMKARYESFAAALEDFRLSRFGSLKLTNESDGDITPEMTRAFAADNGIDL
jgi:hypothetical protein